MATKEITLPALPAPFDPKLFEPQTGDLYVFGDISNSCGDNYRMHPRCCWLLPPGRTYSQWRLEPYALGTLPVTGSPKKLYALFSAYLLTGHWPKYEEGYPR